MLFAAAFTRGSAQTGPFELEVEKEQGLLIVTFRISHGKVRVYLPDELHSGEAFSGSVVALEPLSSALGYYSIQFAGQNSIVKDGGFRWNVPSSATGGNEPLLLKDHLGRVSAASYLPIVGPTERTRDFPSEVTPRFVQAGGTAMILGEFDGDSRTTAIEIGGSPAPVLAECSNYVVVQIPPEAVGTAGYKVTKGDSHRKGTVQGVRIELQTPRHSLKGGEASTLTVSVRGLKGLKRALPVRIDNLTPSLVTIRAEDVPNQSLRYIWIRPDQLNRDGDYAGKFQLSGIQPGVFKIQARIVFPRTQVEEVAMILGQPRKDFNGWPWEEHAEALRALPYDTMPAVARLLTDGELGDEAARTLLELDADRGLAMILASMPASDRNVQNVGFGRFLREYFNGRRRFAADAHDAATKVLETGTNADAEIEALLVVGVTGGDGDFPLLERYAKYEHQTPRWQEDVRDAAEEALARLGSKPHLAKIKQELSQFKGDTYPEAVRLDRLLKKAAFTGNADLTDAICPHVWDPVRRDYDVIAVPAWSAAVALSAIAENNSPLLPVSDPERWQRICRARGIGPRKQ
jgi:hypothetical protein